MSTRRAVATLLAMMLSAAGISLSPRTPPASAQPVDASSSDSAMTLPGKPGGEFADLKVTVSQTTHLINQVVTVSWKGGKQTVPASGEFAANYLQIMQCWGDDPNGPDRTQCQYGAVVGNSPSAGNYVRTRQLNYPGTLVDPKETLKAQPGSFQSAYVPFWAADKDKPDLTAPATSGTNEFFDALGTNEIPVARTHGDGSGQEYFEIQTVRQAAGLGCGEPVTTGGSTGRKCWLVVVPRGATEVNGKNPEASRGGFLDSSPLSQSNWDNRIFFPLEFIPVGQNCPIGAPERRVIGHELVADAVSRWQPVLCAGGGALFNYVQLGDETVRNQVQDGSSPGLALLTNPIPPDQTRPKGPLVYAPVGLSGLAIAFNIEAQPPADAPPEDVQLDGKRFLSMNLTPRLVAKLLTQSYRGAVAGVQDYLKTNPAGLTDDPEFLALNTMYKYKGFEFANTPPDALVQLGGSDLTSLLWSWVTADPDANAFLAGKADPFGMVVNSKNKGLPLPTSTFPRNDQSCLEQKSNTGTVPPPPVCTLDTHPFTNDMHDSSLSTSRGDSQAREPDSIPPYLPKKLDRQTPGRRALLAVVDVATAARYGLPTASLLNAAKKFVPPTTDSLLAGEAAMKPSDVAGVLVPDPGSPDPAAYPLTALSYAATSPSKLDAAAGKDYAAFLRYAAGPGQEPGVAPGQLPFGMAPLPDKLKAQTIIAAATIEARAGHTPGGPTAPQPTSAGIPTGVPAAGLTGGESTAGTGGNPTRSGDSSVVTPSAATSQTGGGLAAKPPGAVQRPVAGVRRTPSLPAPAVGALLVVILICGALAATSSPVMHFLSDAGWRRLRKGVMPTDQ